MRVIAGRAKSLRLKTPDGMGTRPTTDRIKETLFNMFRPEALSGSTFLDIFAGSGAIGIEALSRGAKKAVFIEQNEKASACIRDNLAFTKLPGGLVMEKDFSAALSSLKGETFDFVFMDPPYALGAEEAVLKGLITNGLLNDRSLIIIEAGLDRAMPDFTALHYELIREKTYTTNRHLFLIPLKE